MTTPTLCYACSGLGCGDCAGTGLLTVQSQPKNERLERSTCRHRWVRVFGIAYCRDCGRIPAREEWAVTR